MKNKIKNILFTATTAVALNGFAQEEEVMDDMFDMSIEDLMDMEVTTMAGKATPLSKTSAAVYILTGEDIKRSGATSIPEALRFVPGLNVARIDSNKWAVSARGFNDRFANKLLVMIDGKTVFNPMFSGVYWDSLGLILEDIERIEIIRGSGGSSWGTVAVNGIINIITKNTKDTQGGLISARTGTEEKGMGAFRYGGQLNEQTYYKVWGKYSDTDNFHDDSIHGNNAHDDWDMASGGFKIDYNPSLDDTFSLDFAIFESNAHERNVRTYHKIIGLIPQIPPTPIIESWDEYEKTQINSRGGHILGKYEHIFSETSNLSLQLYGDRYERRDGIHQTIDTYDNDLKYSFELMDNHQMTLGVGYTYYNYHVDNKTWAAFSENEQDEDFDKKSAFIQDDITLIDDYLKLTLGVKFEKNEISGWENQPSARLTFTPTDSTTIWGAISKSVASPDIISNRGLLTRRVGVTNTFPVPVALGGGFAVRNPGNGTVIGKEDLKSETAKGFELGLRQQVQDNLSYELTCFFNEYDNIRAVVPTSNAAVFQSSNSIKGKSYGAELATTYKPVEWWKLRGGYSYLRTIFKDKREDNEFKASIYELKSPEYQIFLQSFMDLSDTVTFDTTYRFVSRTIIADRDIPEYITMDARIGWEFAKNAEISLVGQNLLDPHREEAASTFLETVPSETPRGFYIQLDYKF